ncbi:MAG: Oligopeptide transport system permease protein OppC [Microbacteriaceae bacterium]|nr:Oligopeptide transport system permease protein OppC [Microbacteriaceae bacterium]
MNAVSKTAASAHAPGAAAATTATDATNAAPATTAAATTAAAATSDPRTRPRPRWVRDLAAQPGTILAILFALFLLAALIAPNLVAPSDPYAVDPANAFQKPGLAHLFGTDQSGRDEFSRIVWGARQSLWVGVLATLIGVIGGLVLGLIAGLGGRIADAVTSRFIEILFAFPGLLLALVLIVVLGRGIGPAAVAVGIGSIPGYARILRGQVLQVRQSGYVEASRALGWSPLRRLRATVIPNTLRPLVAILTLGIGQAVVWASALGFLGLGAEPPTAEWGTMLADGRSYIQVAWWIAFFPGLFITVTALSATAIGHFLQKQFEPKKGR